MLVIKLVSKWEICWALWSLIVFDPNNNFVFFEREKNCTAALCIFSLIIVKSLQLHGHRKIAESRK